MIKPYRVEQAGKTFYVIEVGTDLKIEKFKDRRESEKFCKQLNSGKGFNGCTPPFFALK